MIEEEERLIDEYIVGINKTSERGICFEDPLERGKGRVFPFGSSECCSSVFTHQPMPKLGIANSHFPKQPSFNFVII